MGEAGVAMTLEEEDLAIMVEVVEVGDITEEEEEEVAAVVDKVEEGVVAVADITPLVTKATAARETRLNIE